MTWSEIIILYISIFTPIHILISVFMFSNISSQLWDIRHDIDKLYCRVRTLEKKEKK